MKNNLLNKIDVSLLKFINWLDDFGDLSYDRMDYWSSKQGILAKKIFYKNKVLGIPLALWGLMLENFIPNVQKLYSHKHREVIGDAHYAMAFLNLYEQKKELIYLQKAEKYLDEMLKYSSNNYSGLGWGYNFGWQTSEHYWESGIPLITITPYAFWAFLRHYELTKNQKSYKTVISIGEFALKDLNKRKMGNETICSSYSPITKDIVINANSYRAAVLLGVYKLEGNKKYLEEANESIDFILSFQGNKGEWYYEAKPPKDNFIDNFHTCFVLRNLYICNQINTRKDVSESITHGYKFYNQELFYENHRPKHFAKAKYAKLRKYEMYDYAEGIQLGVLLDGMVRSIDKSIFLANDLIDNFQLKKGYFVTRVTSLGTYHKVPYHRWPQAQLFHALTLLYKHLHKEK